MSCAPVNALQKLSTHAQVDRSLQLGPHAQNSQAQGFRRTLSSKNLEAEFQQHQQNQQQFNPLFANAFAAPKISLQQPARRQTASPASAAGSWAQGFAQQQQKQSNWGVQFAQQLNPQMNLHKVASSDKLMQQNVQFAEQMSQQAMRHHPMQQPQLYQQPAISSFHAMSEHQQLHHSHLHAQLESDFEHDELEKQFQSLEKEFATVELKDEAAAIEQELPQLKDQTQFKNAAKEISQVMSSTNALKFQNSKFLELMNQIHTGKVELNNDETKLVDQKGNDIMEAKQDQEPRLPDPLANLKPGDVLDSPYQSAKLVGESHGEHYTWRDEVYDDYRNDDTSF